MRLSRKLKKIHGLRQALNVVRQCKDRLPKFTFFVWRILTKETVSCIDNWNYFFAVNLLSNK